MRTTVSTTRLAPASWWIAGAAALLASAIAASAKPAAPDTAKVMLTIELPDNPTVGARLFAAKQCVRCHSLGVGESRVGPDLGRILFSGNVLDLAGALWNHATLMHEKMRELKIPAPTLSSREMADIIAFLTAYRYYLTQLGEPANPTRGRGVFEAKRCTTCHGDVDDFRKRGPALVPNSRRFSAISLAQAMWNHGAAMEAEMRRAGVRWPQFKGHEMADLLAYLETGNASDAERVYFEPGSPRRGGEIFAQKRCSDCHAATADRLHHGPDLSSLGRDVIGPLPAIAALMWNHSQGMTAEFARRGIPRVRFSGQEMADVIAYLYFVNYARVSGTPARGAELFASKCAPCHAGMGASANDLLGREALDEPIAIMAAMWNHAATMERELRRRGMPWPRLGPSDAADLVAYLLVQRSRARRADNPAH